MPDSQSRRVYTQVPTHMILSCMINHLPSDHSLYAALALWPSLYVRIRWQSWRIILHQNSSCLTPCTLCVLNETTTYVSLPCYFSQLAEYPELIAIKSGGKGEMVWMSYHDMTAVWETSLHWHPELYTGEYAKKANEDPTAITIPPSPWDPATLPQMPPYTSILVSVQSKGTLYPLHSEMHHRPSKLEPPALSACASRNIILQVHCLNLRHSLFQNQRYALR